MVWNRLGTDETALICYREFGAGDDKAESTKGKRSLMPRQSGNSSEDGGEFDIAENVFDVYDDGADAFQVEYFNMDEWVDAADAPKSSTEDAIEQEVILVAKVGQSVEAAKAYYDESFVVITSYYDGSQFGQEDDGNFYLYEPSDSTANFYAVNDSVITSTPFEEFFFFYPDVMTAYGVSRLRHGTIDHLPVTADIITLAAVTLNGTTSTLVPATPDGKFYYTTICNYEDDALPTKLFIVADIEKGPERLQADDLQFTVTGGKVTSCEYWPLVAETKGVDWF
jgi:hypothetical protein